MNIESRRSIKPFTEQNFRELTDLKTKIFDVRHFNERSQAELKAKTKNLLFFCQAYQLRTMLLRVALKTLQAVAQLSDRNCRALSR